MFRCLNWTHHVAGSSAVSVVVCTAASSSTDAIAPVITAPLSASCALGCLLLNDDRFRSFLRRFSTSQIPTEMANTSPTIIPLIVMTSLVIAALCSREAVLLEFNSMLVMFSRDFGAVLSPVDSEFCMVVFLYFLKVVA